MTIRGRRVSLSLGAGLVAAGSVYACEGEESNTEPDGRIIPADAAIRRPEAHVPPAPFDPYAVCLKRPQERKLPISLFVDGGEDLYVSVRVRGKQLYIRTKYHLYTIGADGSGLRMLYAFYSSGGQLDNFIVDDDGVFFEDPLNPKGEYALIPHDGGSVRRISPPPDASPSYSRFGLIVGSDAKYLYAHTRDYAWRVDKQAGTAELLNASTYAWEGPVRFAGSSLWRFSTDHALRMHAVPDASVEKIWPCPSGQFVGEETVFCGQRPITRFTFDGGSLPSFEVHVPERDGGSSASVFYAGPSYIVAVVHENLRPYFQPPAPERTDLDIFVRRNVDVSDETVVGCSLRKEGFPFGIFAASDAVLAWTLSDGQNIYILEY